MADGKEVDDERLHVAAKKGDVDCMKEIIDAAEDNEARKELINRTDHYSR